MEFVSGSNLASGTDRLEALSRSPYEVGDREAGSLVQSLYGRRCGLVTNHTGVSRDGVPTLAVLESTGADIVRLFSPEHGIAGVLEGHVGDSAANGRAVISLYGEHRRPTAGMLEGLDVLVFDIQDIGARFYTYSSTMALCLEACAEYGVAMVILDRPNPLGDVQIEGPIVDEELRSFIGHLRIPIVHGMTMGELARWHQRDAALRVELSVLPVSGWKRNQTWHDAPWPWIAPSPNIPDFEAARWYPGPCLWEFFDVSVGRGTDWPFRVIAAPWLDAGRLAAALEPYRTELDGIAWTPLAVTPQRATHEGVPCHGLRFYESGERTAAALAPVRLGLAVIYALCRSHPQQMTKEHVEKCLSLLGSRATLDKLIAGDLASACRDAEADEARWMEMRKPVLLYD